MTSTSLAVTSTVTADSTTAGSTTAGSTVSPGTTGPASQRVADYLREAILGGDIGPGERVRQADVAERFGASRLPVREALRMLAAEGLIEHETNKGARVPRLDMHEVDVIYQMRERLEPLALSESMPHLSGEDLRRLDDIQSQIEEGTDVARFLQLDREFHLLTYSRCHNDQLTAMVTRLWNSTQHYRRAFVSSSGPGRRWVINAEHRLLLDAIQRGDSTDAERHLAGHIRRTRVELAKHPEVIQGAPS
jgi:DNA-binding GntR family transcriptional regulator